MKRTVAVVSLMYLAATTASRAQLPPVPVPPENPITQPKRVLGKILFWDEQLSSDNTVACGTCHITGNAGTDPRFSTHPGLDGVFGGDDDVLGAEGVISAGAQDAFLPDALFGLTPQVTSRSAPGFLMAAYHPETFWDGRAGSTFLDPETGATSVANGGALENQVVGPPVSDVEMAHESRDWTQITAKLERSRPMALADDVPADMQAAIDVDRSYPDLFEAAFGDPAITAERIAFAIATYERTLVPDQTPWDQGTLTPQQQQGFNAFLGVGCAICHAPPLFTNNTFRNIGLRPVAEDPGRQEVTGNPGDRGRFKVPTLRNVGLKSTMMHNGRITDVPDAINFYMQLAGHQQFTNNRDPTLPIPPAPPGVRANLANFIVNGLTDPRVANETFPFDRPTLHSELPTPNPRVTGAGTVGTGGFEPIMIAVSPPNLGNEDFKIGVRDALGGAEAYVAMSSSPPVGGVVAPDELHGPIALDGSGAGEGFGTWHWPIPDDHLLIDTEVFVQWIVTDPSGAGGQALSPAARLTFFCIANCPCAGDTDGDATIDVDDIVNVVLDYGTDGSLNGGDADGSGFVDVDDIVYVVLHFGPCL